ncbi:hypothetical protein FOCC_FOCC015740 [Frankliniella occidentalis]|nr:hypothetical protein FOCC_FOCC015740 [Frankliniella occidentalis]
MQMYCCKLLWIMAAVFSAIVHISMQDAICEIQLFENESHGMDVGSEIVEVEVYGGNQPNVTRWESQFIDKPNQVSIGHMCNGFYLCADHFNMHQFNSKNNDILKKTAIPSLFDSNPIGDDAMSAYDIGWNIREFNVDTFVEYMEKNIIDVTEDDQISTHVVNEESEVNISNDALVESVGNRTNCDVKKCCVQGCVNIFEKLYSFPNVFKKGGKVINLQALQTCREWLRKCGNPLLLNRNPSKLFEEVFVCEGHFSNDAFYKYNKSKLKVAAIPIHFQYECLSDELMYKFDMAWKMPQILSNKITEFDEDEQKNVATEDDVVPVVINELEENNNVVEPIRSYTRLQKCCYLSCNGSNRETTMFRFPNVLRKLNGVMQVDQTKLDRFLQWLKNIGNGILLLYDPKFINEKFFVCKDHFEEKFINYQKVDKLIPSAVPMCAEHVLSDESVEQYCLNLNRWSDNNYDAICFDVTKRAASDFDDEMKNLKWNVCVSCKEKFLVKGDDETKCLHKDKCWEYCGINNMDPGDVPIELQGLTFIEERLIARVHPLISVYMLTRNGQYGYRKNVINFSQKIDSFARELPMKITDLNSIIVVRKEGEDNTYHDFHVRAHKVKAALVWLKHNNKFYEDIMINEDNLNLLPEDSNVSDEIQSYCGNDISEKNVIPMDVDDGICEESNIDDPYRTVVSDVHFPHQDEQIRNYLNWPSFESQPIDEYSTPGYIACAFPTLFCYGKADLRDWHEKDVNASNYFRHLLRYRDERFSKHKTFRFFAYNSWMRWTALTDGNVYVKQNEEFKNMTVDQLKEILKENPNILKKVMFHARNLRGSKAYWHSRAGELHDMVNQLHMPTIFLTLSAADLHWKDLYRLLTGKEDLSELTEFERHKLLRDNPQVVDEFFDMRVNAFLKHVLIKKYNVIDYWYRIEYQHRGSCHLHGVFWFENAPNCDKMEEATQEELDVIVDYFNDLISAINPDSHSEREDDHPCRKVYGNVTDFQKDLAELLNTVQRHTKCSTEYCIKYNNRTKESKCRFGFPILDLNDQAKCVANESGEIEFCPARNDDRLNKYNQFIIQLWRANMDIAPVISKKRLLAYLSKYISKSEVSSGCVLDLMKGILDSMNEESKCVHAIQRFFIKACVERDVSAQEVSHILLGLKLHSSGKRSFVIVNFNNKKWCQILTDDENLDDGTSGKSFIEKYKDRPAFLENVSLWDVAKKYNVAKWKLLSSNAENIVRVFPIVKLKVDEENDKYFEQQVYLHVPWRNDENLRNENESWNEAYIRYGLSNVPGVVDLLENVASDEAEGEEDDEELLDGFYEAELERENNEEWMVCSSIGRGRIDQVELGKRHVDINYPWMGSFEMYEQYGTIEEFQNFIREQKKMFENSNELETNAFVNSPNISLSCDQQKVLQLVTKQIESIECNNTNYACDDVVKTCIVQGKAGTGKSLVIAQIRKLLTEKYGKDSYVLGTPTGVSALLIKGKTVHSIFRIPRESKNFKPLAGEQARKLNNEFANVKFLIIDEYSMIGSRMMGMINRRCKEATGNYAEDFGGLFTYFFGDIKQLPPVKDKPIYSYNQNCVLSQCGYNAMQNIQKCIILNKIHRQNDSQFLNILNNISEGVVTKEDYEVLRTRMKGSVSNYNEFDDALHLFATKEEVRNFNISKLSELRDSNNDFVPVLKVEARTNCVKAKKASTDEAQGLEQNLYLAKGCNIMLRTNLWLAKGLVNGAMGKIVDILYNDKTEVSIHHPTVLLCEFENYTGPSIIPGSNVVPVPTMLSSWTNRHNESLSRIQFPISLSYACSIHKSQGLTLSKAVVHIGEKEFALGLTYVAMSRVKSLNSIMLYPFSFSRISKLNSGNLILRNDFLQYISTKCVL